MLMHYKHHNALIDALFHHALQFTCTARHENLKTIMRQIMHCGRIIYN